MWALALSRVSHCGISGNAAVTLSAQFPDQRDAFERGPVARIDDDGRALPGDAILLAGHWSLDDQVPPPKCSKKEGPATRIWDASRTGGL